MNVARPRNVAEARLSPWTAPPYLLPAARCPLPQGLGVATGLELSPTFPMPCPAAYPDAGLPDNSKGSKKPLTPHGQVTKGLGRLGAL